MCNVGWNAAANVQRNSVLNGWSGYSKTVGTKTLGRREQTTILESNLCGVRDCRCPYLLVAVVKLNFAPHACSFYFITVLILSHVFIHLFIYYAFDMIFIYVHNKWKWNGNERANDTCRCGVLCLCQPITSWTVTNVVEWLAVVGLHRYAHIFRQHRVDGETLSELTSDTLVVSIINWVQCFYKGWSACKTTPF